ncbi:tRNA (adenosine(37)-N6)-threonylcarbamoyltransferase complex ATPase subunit type 1 TsaE [Candidatus Laterigemmans baculatus]|nr:tRNA (adenosine(37)-N6)-threonylcarbamoyltransferase complex ATPase subunit type 1 TsaE [Candidatus Laterigemmans baculatus]
MQHPDDSSQHPDEFSQRPDEFFQRIELADLHDTERLGRWLAEHLPGGSCVGLVGTLGAGKTRLAQAIIAAQGVEREAVTSPTFSLLRSYAAGNRTLHHLDAYRLHDEDEFLELGVEELWEDETAVMLIEWARRVERCLPAATLWIEMEWTASERRIVTVRGHRDPWEARLAGLASEFTSA